MSQFWPDLSQDVARLRKVRALAQKRTRMEVGRELGRLKRISNTANLNFKQKSPNFLTLKKNLGRKLGRLNCISNTAKLHFKTKRPNFLTFSGIAWGGD